MLGENEGDLEDEILGLYEGENEGEIDCEGD
jgi:hypothetical protein